MTNEDNKVKYKYMISNVIDSIQDELDDRAIDDWNETDCELTDLKEAMLQLKELYWGKLG